ncbi:unnamed protein product [Victoria cruziana]
MFLGVQTIVLLRRAGAASARWNEGDFGNMEKWMIDRERRSRSSLALSLRLRLHVVQRKQRGPTTTWPPVHSPSLPSKTIDGDGNKTRAAESDLRRFSRTDSPDSIFRGREVFERKAVVAALRYLHVRFMAASNLQNSLQLKMSFRLRWSYLSVSATGSRIHEMKEIAKVS